jgi:hypothetical protein
MPAEPPPNPPPSGAPPPDAFPPVSPENIGTGQLETEQALNSPSPLTLRLLGVIFAATFIPWVGAKVACNRREGPTRPPLELPVAELSKQPKDAAIELQQRAATNHFREAAELAKGDVAVELLAADARCQAEPLPCEQARARSQTIFTRAVVVRRGPLVAEVRAESDFGAGRVERFTMRLEPDAGRWYVVSRAPFAGALDEPSAGAPGAAPSSPAAGEMSVVVTPVPERTSSPTPPLPPTSSAAAPPVAPRTAPKLAPKPAR